MSIGERITEARERLGLTKGELSRRIEVRPETIGRYEAGHLTPRAEALSRLAEVLGVTTDYLMGRDPDPTATTSEPVHDDELPLIERALAMYAPVEPAAANYVRERYQAGYSFLGGATPEVLVPWVRGELTAYKATQDGTGMPPKVKEAPFTKVDVGEGAMKRAPRSK